MSVTFTGMIRTLVVFLLSLLMLAAALFSAPAHAWWAYGHRLVARLAEHQLTPEARTEVHRLLALEHHRSLADVASWADELREHDPDLGRRSAKWHYVNLGEHDCLYDAKRDCPNGDCIVEAINTQAAILADRTRPDAERLQALKFVVHFTGDAHQPMHAGYAHDRGGNSFQVNYKGRGSNLHSLWDGTLLESRRINETAYYERLRASPSAAAHATDAFSAIAPAQWTEASCRIAMQPGVYPASARIDDAYIERHRPIAERQLQRAGARLAQLLNATLG